ncbi:FixH family protein [Marinoscillum sp. MHG1-6]|uniref:FixH family protein n=1 Tax=Marinoscillum sp. MHG1-6 TaxID=2959627 RepID=UPI002157DAB8|nr:FixH family protein [Marinoscillum sp. MHG1-6]
MKWNWGTGIVGSFALFCGFVIYVVVQSFRLDVDLVSDTYYMEELNYQERIDHKSNLAAAGVEVTTVQTGEELNFEFPREFEGAEGDIHFYHPSREIFDRHFKIALNESNVQLIKKSDLVKGRYKVKLNWKAGDKSYFQETEVFVR